MNYGTLQPERNRIDSLTDSVLAFLEKSDRGFCQETESENCFLLAEISDVKTSNQYCSRHFYEHQGRLNLRIIRKADRGI